MDSPATPDASSEKASTTPLHIILNRYYEPIPEVELFHYTSLDSYLSILRTKTLWASEVRYLNDAQEMSYFARQLDMTPYESADVSREEASNQLRTWLQQRLRQPGHKLFVVSLSEEGNLLSQWRSYTAEGRGISIGFEPRCLMRLAHAQGFRFGKCFYAGAEATVTAKIIFHEMVEHAVVKGPSARSHPRQSYFPAFAELEDELLQIAALFKNPAFEEEREWRIVSPISKNYVLDELHYRAGNTTIIPYVEFALDRDEFGVDAKNPIRTVYVGPTPNNNLSMETVSQCLTRSGLGGGYGRVVSSQIPYRKV